MSSYKNRPLASPDLGYTGYTGLGAYTGYTGYTGLPGSAASTGATGYTGPAGLIGVTLHSYANNAAAKAGGLVAGDFYKNGGDPDTVCVVV